MEEQTMTEWKKNAVHPLRIEGYTAEGMGVARLEGRVVFVPFTARGALAGPFGEGAPPHGLGPGFGAVGTLPRAV